MSATNLGQWGVGALIGMIYALNRFETPSPARATMTFVRYSIARACTRSEADGTAGRGDTDTSIASF